MSLSVVPQLEPLAGTAHPVVYRVRFACPCGDEHDGLVSHDELDWAPLGLEGGVFLNLMTSRVEPVSAELSGAGGGAHQGGGVAVELLLLPGGAAAAGVPLVLLPARAG